MKKVNVELSPKIKADKVETFEKFMRSKIVGQDEAIDTLVSVYQEYLSGLTRPNQPIANLMFLGPTGTGKTHIVETMAEALFGNPFAVIKIDCAEFQHSHHIERLSGSPPGYLGFKETVPVLSTENLNKYHTPSTPITLLLLDEIEKANEALHQLMLGILDKAQVTLGDNRRVDFSKCIIFFTSNVGAKELGELTDTKFGFNQVAPSVDKAFKKMDAVAVAAAKKKFSPEFINRIDKTVVFKTLNQEHVKKIIEIELGSIQDRLLDTDKPFVFNVTPSAKAEFLKNGYDATYNARPVRRILEDVIVKPFASMLVSGQINKSDFIQVDFDGNYHYMKKGEDCIIPPRIQFRAEAPKEPRVYKTAKDSV